MPFIPHLNGSRSTQVSRLLHTSVHHAPHLCGLSADYQCCFLTELCVLIEIQKSTLPNQMGGVLLLVMCEIFNSVWTYG